MADDPDPLAASAREVLSREWDSRRLHGFFDGEDAAEARLADLARDLGWLSAALPAALGGLELGAAGAAALLREAGRACAPGALFAALTAGLWLDAIHHLPGAEALAAELAEGRHSLLLPGIDWTPLPSDAASGIAGRLEGMIGGRAPTAALVPLATEDGAAIALIRLGDTAQFRRADAWDRSRTVGGLHCRGARPVVVLGDSGGIPAARLLEALRLAVAADSMGGAEAAFDATLAYALEREQFGRRIGSFQVVKHRLATMRIGREIPDALLTQAAGALARGEPGAGEAIAMARASCAAHYRSLADESVLLHGGIGYTWDMDPQVRVKRAALNALLGGTRRSLGDEIFSALVAPARQAESAA